MDELLIFVLIILCIHYHNMYSIHKEMHEYYKNENDKNQRELMELFLSDEEEK